MFQVATEQGRQEGGIPTPRNSVFHISYPKRNTRIHCRVANFFAKHLSPLCICYATASPPSTSTTTTLSSLPLGRCCFYFMCSLHCSFIFDGVCYDGILLFVPMRMASLTLARIITRSDGGLADNPCTDGMVGFPWTRNLVET